MQITAAVVPRAPVLVRLLLAGAVGALPSPRCGDVSDVLVALLKVRPVKTTKHALCCQDLLDLTNAPPPQMLEADIARVLLQATHDQGLQWLKAAVDVIPDESATAADREQLLSAAVAVSQSNNAAGVRWGRPHLSPSLYPSPLSSILSSQALLYQLGIDLLDIASAILMSCRLCSNRPVGHAIEELSELVRRNRRSLEAAQRTLLGGIQLYPAPQQ